MQRARIGLCLLVYAGALWPGAAAAQQRSGPRGDVLRPPTGDLGGYLGWLLVSRAIVLGVVGFGVWRSRRRSA